MKKALFFLVFLCSIAIVSAQEIEIKKGIISIDGKECLKMTNEDAVSVSFTDMSGNELFFLRFIHDSPYAKLYNKVVFPEQKLSFTSESYIYTKKLLVDKLVKAKVIEDCKINIANLEKFIMKYDENVERPR